MYIVSLSITLFWGSRFARGLEPYSQSLGLKKPKIGFASLSLRVTHEPRNRYRCNMKIFYVKYTIKGPFRVVALNENIFVGATRKKERKKRRRRLNVSSVCFSFERNETLLGQFSQFSSDIFETVIFQGRRSVTTDVPSASIAMNYAL